MIADATRSLWTEPRAPGPPARVWRDWAVLVVFICSAVLEGLLRRNVPLRPVAVLVAVTLVFTVLWRRTHPLGMLALAFGAGIAMDIASIVLHTQGQIGLYTMAYQLLLPYALFRWGSGREMVLGSGIALTAFAFGIAMDHTPAADSAAGFVVLSFPVALGLTTRFWATTRVRDMEQVRLRERELLARELHDTVAHHVSAMVIRAQAGRVVAQSRPVAAVEALEVIEREGSRTLAEMRAMVGALREGDHADLAPVGGIADIERLARPADGRPSVHVSRSGVPQDVSPSVEAALYRIAQESVTNALRHARHASQVVIRITGDGGQVRLTVRDDGDQVPAASTYDGYGIVGMTERAALLGGSLAAGPGPDRGWLVEAVLPRTGSAA